MAKNRQGCSVLVPVDWNKSSFLAVEKEREVNYKKHAQGQYGSEQLVHPWGIVLVSLKIIFWSTARSTAG